MILMIPDEHLEVCVERDQTRTWAKVKLCEGDLVQGEDEVWG